MIAYDVSGNMDKLLNNSLIFKIEYFTQSAGFAAKVIFDKALPENRERGANPRRETVGVCV